MQLFDLALMQSHDVQQTQQSIPDSPAALARHVTSDGYREAQQQILREVRSSYEV